MDKHISMNINYLCSKKKLTQNEFGAIFNLGKGVVSTYVSGKSTPKIETIQQICEYFDISIDDFINRDLNSNKESSNQIWSDDVLLAAAGSKDQAVFVAQKLQSKLKDKETIIDLQQKRIIDLEDELQRCRNDKS